MRTTLTIDDCLLRDLKELAHRAGKPLKQVINSALQAGIEEMRHPRTAAKRYKSKTFSLGNPATLNLDKALAIAGALEDEEIARKLVLRK